MGCTTMLNWVIQSYQTSKTHPSQCRIIFVNATAALTVIATMSNRAIRKCKDSAVGVDMGN